MSQHNFDVNNKDGITIQHLCAFNLFNRGYDMGTQMQIEAGNFLNLTTDEGSTTQLWDIMANTMDGNILQEIASATSWQPGFIWH